MADQQDIRRYSENYQDEVDSAALYRAMSAAEKQPQLSKVYLTMAEIEEQHLDFWEEKIKTAGGVVPPRTPGWRTRVLMWVAKRFGPQAVLPTVVGKERGGSASYIAQPETVGTNLPAAESSHERVLLTIAGKSRTGMEGGLLAQLEGRHRASGGNALRAAVLGANDGLVSNLSLVMGVAGAELAGKSILITGLAGLLAGAASMALGEWLSVQSSRELYQHQLDIENQEILAAPEEEQEELALIYQAKGLPAEPAKSLAARIMTEQSSSLDTLAREELGINPEELGGSAWEAALTSFFLFALGAIIPVLPFILFSGTTAVFWSMAFSAVGLFILGAGITLFTGRNVFASGLRQVLFGLLAAGLTFGIGRLIGVSIGG
jgi:VIT1/CCC1 family predicted Fe2+/Mn2+ transporter